MQCSSAPRIACIRGAPDRAAQPEPGAAVVGDDPVPSLEEDAFLLFPRVPVERVAVNEHDRLPGAVVLVVDLDVVAVLPADGDLCHCLAFLLGAMVACCWSGL